MSNPRIETDDWRAGPHVLDQDAIHNLARTLDETELIVEHWFYRGARSPERRIFTDAADLQSYVNNEVRPGDVLWAWRFDAVCKDNSAVAHGKWPDADGTAPLHGAY